MNLTKKFGINLLIPVFIFFLEVTIFPMIVSAQGITVNFEDRGAAVTNLNGTYDNINWGNADWMTGTGFSTIETWINSTSTSEQT